MTRVLQPKKLLLDLTLILLGAGLSILLVFTEGIGQVTSTVGAQMMFFLGVTALVSFGVARFVRSVVFAALISIFATDLALVLLLFLPQELSASSDMHESRQTFFRWPFVLVVFTAPMVVLSSVGFVRLASRFYQRRTPPSSMIETPNQDS